MIQVNFCKAWTNLSKDEKIQLCALGTLGLVVVGGGTYVLYKAGCLGGLRKLPPGPRPWAVFGTSMHLGPSPCRALAKLCAQEYGGLMTVYMGGIPTVIITSPKIAVQIMEKYDTAFRAQVKFTWPYMLLFPAGYQNLKCVPPYNGPHWHRLRVIYLKHLLQQAHVLSFRPTHEHDVAIMLQNLKEEMARGDSANPGWVLLRPHLRLVAFKVLFSICFGKRVDHIVGGIGSHKDPNVMQLEFLFMEIVRLGPAFIISDFLPAACHLPTPIDLQRAATAKRLDKVFMMVIQDYRERATTKAPGACNVDFVDTLVSLKGDNKLHDREIVWLLSELILANTDNIAAILEWTLANLMVNPILQDKVHEEIDKVCGKKPHVAEHEINNMPYLHAVVKESMRLSAPIMLTVPHSTTREIVLGGYRLPVNTQVLCHLGALGHHPDVHENPHHFDPTRHLDANPPHDSPLKKQMAVAFLAARKLCPGMGLDTLHVHIFLVKILQLFELSPLYGDIKPLKLTDTVEWGVINLLRKPLVACLKPHL